jgi:hypothetical protein
MMKYLLLIHTNPANWSNLPKAEQEGLHAEYGVFTKEIVDSGELVGGERLAGPDTVRTVRVRDGIAEVVDGPYAESKEHLGGYYLVDVDGPERAEELAARIPDARYVAVEVRPVLDMGGQEM